MTDTTQESYGVIIAKKSERLVTALYLVTDFVDGHEPIKNRLRNSSVVLLSSMNALAQHDVKDKFSLFSSSLASVTEIMSLLHVAMTTGMISDMNGTLLVDGFRVLQMILEKKQPIITEDMLYVEAEESLYENTPTHPGIVRTSYDAITPRTRDVVKDRRDTDEARKGAIHAGALPAREPSLETKPSLHTVLIQHATRQGQGLSSSFQTRKQSRKDQILALFVKGVDVSIKDITARIKGCSEKTIQRELNALVYDNKIERIGEKRWSRYVLR